MRSLCWVNIHYIFRQAQSQRNQPSHNTSMTSLTIHSERRVSLIKAYLMVFKDLIKYARAIAEIARHWSENKSHIMQDLQIVFCLVILLMFFLQKKLKIRTKPTFPFLPRFTFFFLKTSLQFKQLQENPHLHD